MTDTTNPVALSFQALDKTKLAIAGGKGANLGELCRIDEINVPRGFCITTNAFKKIMAQSASIGALLDQLSVLKADQGAGIVKLSARIRAAIEAISIPEDLGQTITNFLNKFHDQTAFAIRSSATAEDLPIASFAGQQDTYLNVMGREAILKHISKCWASLFTERAIIYRIQNGFDHTKVQLAVIVQQMVFPQAAGILFTADPVTSNRKILSIDAGFGLGEAMVSGLVNADNYKVDNGQITGKTIPLKKIAVYAQNYGGTREEEIDVEQQNAQVLTDEQILQLAAIGRRIEKHFGNPQDIEWCLADGVFYIVQSRPITTLFPIPEAADQDNHVYISVGHQQMMTDAMKPLGLSLWQLTAARQMYKAGGRLFVDVTGSLKSVAGRTALLKAMEQHDPLIKNALEAIISRDFIRLLPAEDEAAGKPAPTAAPPMSQAENDLPIVADLIARSDESLGISKKNIVTKEGTELFDFILEDLPRFRQSLFRQQNMAAIMAVVNASAWINEKMLEWLGEKNMADSLSQSVANNVTSEMGLALLDVADVIRPYPEVVNYLQQANDDQFLDKLLKLKGGSEAREAINVFLDKYGMRCPGEIDITKARWKENPKSLLPAIIGNTKNFEPGESRRRFERGLKEALEKEHELLERLKQLPEGNEKAGQTKGMIRQLRDFAGYREYPKYSIISHLWVFKQALLKEAETLVQSGIILQKEDVHYLTFNEFKEVVHTQQANHQLISQRKEEHKINEKLNSPRVITSDGEIIRGEYKPQSLPAGAIVGLAVSAGIIEGRARVILNMDYADFEEGDILVTVFTDPSWTPLFVSIKGLITEVGGLMTHGAVIAREYGLPAVVGVENATRLIKDGQRIRVNGTEGYVEIL